MTTLEALRKLQQYAISGRPTAGEGEAAMREHSQAFAQLNRLIEAIETCPVDDVTELANVCLT